MQTRINKTEVNRYQVRDAKNLPEKKIRAGAINATIWKNQGADKNGGPVEYRTVSLERNYQNNKGEWASTSSLRANDLPRAILCLQKAFEFIAIKDGSDEEQVV